MVKLVSWNVNGLRACLKKGFVEAVTALDADFICLQETKMEQGQAEVELPGYHEYWSSAEKKGYSGTAVFARQEPLSVTCGIGAGPFDREGRAITLEYGDFFLVNVYVPNAQQGLTRLDFRMEWEDELRSYLKGLDGKKPVVLCGDLNVAHQEMDLKNPKTNRMNPGFTDQEREKMTALLASGFADTFRTLHPEEITYSWWSYRFHAREKNVGWRIDYFIVSRRLLPRVTGAAIRTEVYGSDHCPVVLEIS